MVEYYFFNMHKCNFAESNCLVLLYIVTLLTAVIWISGFIRGPGDNPKPIAFSFHDKFKQGPLLSVVSPLMFLDFFSPFALMSLDEYLYMVFICLNVTKIWDFLH